MCKKSIFAGAWRRRGHPEDQLDPGGPFGSVLGSRSVLDAVVEEEMSEDDDEDSIAVIGEAEANAEDSGLNGEATAIIVHSRSSSSRSSSFKNVENVWQWYSKLIKQMKKPYQQSLLKDIINYLITN